MNIDFLGCEQGLTCFAGVAYGFDLELLRGDVALDLADVVVSGVVSGADGVVLPVQVGRVEGRVGVVRVEFPALEAGEYGYELLAVGADGVGVRLAWGRLGVLDSALVLGEVRGGADGRRCLRMVLPDGEGGVLQLRWLATGVAEAAAAVCAEAVEMVQGVGALVERMEGVAAGLDGKLSEFIVPDEDTGTWVVGGVDTGKAYKGDDGVDGDKVRRVVVGTVAELPDKGNGGLYYYVEGRLDVYDFEGKGDSVFLYVEDATLLGEVGLSINDRAVEVPESGSLYELADAINTAYAGVVQATVEGDKWVKLTCEGADWSHTYGYGVVYREGSYKVDTYFTKEAPYAVYAWLLQSGVGEWRKIESGRELEVLPTATRLKPGVVRLTSYVSSVGADDAVPTARAVGEELERQLSGVVYAEDVALDYVSKQELADAGYVTQEDLGGYVTQEALGEELAALRGETVRHVVLSESEYAALATPDEEVFYFTFEG